MGGGSSVLNCTSKKKNKNKHKDEPEDYELDEPQDYLDEPGTNLTTELEKHQNNVEELRNKAGEVTKKVGHRDKELVEERVRSREKKFGDVRGRVEKLQKGYRILEADLDDIMEKVRQYLAWLKKKDEQIEMTKPDGYSVRDAEIKLHYINAICSDLENRQVTLDAVNKKIEEVVLDLPKNDREEMERTLKSLISEHQHVYQKAVAHKGKLGEALNAREVFQAGLERVSQWFQEREKRVDKMDKLRLSSVELEKQADKVKTLLMEIEKYAPNVEQIHTRISNLKEDCGTEQVEELDEKLKNVETKFEQLKAKVKNVHEKLCTNIGARKNYEGNLQKLERWCKDTEMKCAVEPPLDCATEILQEQLKQYQALEKTSQTYSSMNKEVQECGQTLLPQLYEADTKLLQQQLKTAQDKYDRVSKVVSDRVKALEEALQTRDQIGDGIEETADWLATIQDDLRRIPRTVGPTVENAEDVLRQYEAVGEKIANYQPTITQLNQAVERLRNLGQHTEAEEILRLTSQYEMLGDQVRQQCKKCQQGVASRQQLADQMKQLDAIVTECEDSADAVIGQGVPVTDKMEKLKEVSEKLQACAPAVFTMGDKAQQIGFEGTEDDAMLVNTQAEELKARADALKKLADRKIKQCESIQKNRDDFESSVNDTISWLDNKGEVLASCGSLDLDPVKVRSTLQKHQALSREALDKLDTVKMKAQIEKAHYQEMDEPIPPQLSEKLEQISTLEDSIQGAIAKKEQYLSEASADRMQLEVSMKQITDWIHGAEEMLDSGYEGVDYDTLNDTLSEQKDYFSEASMCQDEMDQVMELTERLLPTLDMNDSETLRQSLRNTSQKLADVMAASQRKQQELEKKSDEWNEYQDLVLQATQDLQTLEDEWEETQSVPLVNPAAIQKHLKNTMEFIEKVEKFRPLINELNDKSHELDREATEKSRASIDDLMNSVNDRWRQLVGSTENKQMTLQDLEAQYEDYSQLLHSSELLLNEADIKACPVINLDTVTCPELVDCLDQTQEVEDLMEAVEPKITALKKCAQQLQKNLPTAEAKVQSQDGVMALLEKFQRIQDKAKEQKQMLQEEIDDREGFNTEAKQTVDWLTETKVELQHLGPTMEVPEVMEKIEKLRLSEQEIAIRMEQMRHMAQLQETKYRAQGRELPQELKDQITLMNDLEQQVGTAMQDKEEELLHLRQDRQAYSTELKLVTTWLNQATEQLQERVMDIPESTYRHEELLGELDPFKKKLDGLRNRGSDLIKHSKDPIEKQTIQKTLADTNKQWLSVQAQAAERSKQLKEAQDLSKTFSVTAEAIGQWVTQAEAVLIAEPTWTDFDRVREQLKQHKRLLKEADQQQGKLGTLNTVTKQMEPLCDVISPMEKLTDLSHQVFDIRSKTSDKVIDLEETNDQIEDYEKKLAELKQWMEKTRAHLTMRDDTITLKEQLAMQENLIADIEGHKGKAMFVLQKHAELHAAVGEDTPQNTKMAAEINYLLQQAREDCDELREAVKQQEKYETEMQQLTTSISEAQEQLIGSPIQASSVDSLKQQIAEHNELARKIKSDQERVNELSQKSRDLAARSADLGPLLARKLYHNGDESFTVADLAKTLNAPLEPYTVPDRSPTTIKPQKYEGPVLDAVKASTVSPVQSSFSRIYDESHPSDSQKFGDSSIPKSESLRTTPTSGTYDTSPETKNQSRSWPANHSSPKLKSSSKPTDSGLGFPSFSSIEDGQTGLYTTDSAPDSAVETMISVPVPQLFGARSTKWSPESEHNSSEIPATKLSWKVGRDSSPDTVTSDTNFPVSESTDDPTSSFSQLMDLDASAASISYPVFSPVSSPKHDTSDSKARSRFLPLELTDKRPVSGTESNKPAGRETSTESTDVPEDMKQLQQRKAEALSPYKPKSQTLKKKFGGNDQEIDFDSLSKDFEPLSNEFQKPGEQSGGMNLLPSKFEPVKLGNNKDRKSDAWSSKYSPSGIGRTLGSASQRAPLSKSMDASMFRQHRRPSSPFNQDESFRSSPQRPSAPSESFSRHSRSVSPRTVGGSSQELQGADTPHNRTHKALPVSFQGTVRTQESSPQSYLLKPTERFEMDLSRSVPSLLDPQIQELRERSSSFGSRLRPSGSSSLRSSKFDDLNSSWQNLQRQLGVKEKELQVALQKQERYQAAVQDVTARMERVQQRLAGVSPAPYKDMDQQIKEHKESEQEIESIREDVARVKERGRQIMETSDPEGYQAMQATLAMLTDKIDSLQALADDKAKQLQTAMKDRECHDIALTAYRRRVKELEDWLEEMRVRQATTPQSTDGVNMLQQQLQENKDLQGELNIKLQQVADLAIQCDNLCESEPPNNAEKLRMQLATLQKNLGDLKLGAIEKQAPLRTAIKESEKRKREMDDYEKNLKRMQQWISDTKKLASGPAGEEIMITPAKKQELQQQLESDLSQHRRLVHQLSSEMKTRDVRPSREPVVRAPIKEEDIQPRWEALSKELAQKKENLQDVINKTAELVGPGKYGRRYGPDTSSQLKDVRGHLSALNDLWKQLQVQVDDKQLRLEQALDFQQRYQDALHNVSSWLDLAEQKMFTPDSSMNSKEKVKENEDLQREIKSLQGEILSMGRQAQELLAVTNSDSHDLIRQSLGNLNDRVQILEGQAREQGDKLRSVDRQYRQYQDEVHSLEDKLEETRDMMSSPSASAPLSLLVTNMQKIEAQLKKCEVQLEELKKRQAELTALDPEIISPYEMDALQSNYMDLQRKVMEKKASLQQSVSVQEQYEKLLQDYAEFLETADNKLKTEAISARDLDHLKRQLNSHKDFFSDLEVHRAMLDSLVAQCDKATKQKHLPQHTKLSNLTYVLQDKASLHGQRLERLVSQWGEMEEKFNQLQRFLDDIDQQIPKPISDNDTLSAIQSKINTYHRLQRELNDEKPTVFQVVDRGKQLLHSINCPALETLITDLGEKWVDLNTDLSHELKRTQSLGEQLQVFEAESAVLKSWLSAARSKLSGIKQLSSTDLRSIATIRSKIDKILEFRKEVENQLPLKEKVTSIGNQLLENKIYQTHDLEDGLKFFQQEWALLQHDINNAEEYLHQAQMDLMPSRQALGELSAWLTEIEEALFDDRNKPMKNLADMEVLLKKYKSYKIDLSSKQLTVDFVNQDVLQQKDDEVPVLVEQNEFSERLGVLNGRWKEVSGHVSERLKQLEGIHSKWEEFERAMSRLIGWFKDQEDKIKKYRLIGHEVSVRQTLKDVKGMKQSLKNKQIDINLVKEIGQSLVTLSQEAPGCQHSIQNSMDHLFGQKRHLDNQIIQIQKLLEDVLSQWDCYHNELQVMTSTLTETEYCLQRYNLIGGDIATLKIQVEKLEGLMAEMERNVSRHEKFSALATRLSQVCEVPVRQEIQKTQTDIQNRWQSVFSELHTRTDRFRECLQTWLSYEADYNKARTWLDAKEKLCDELVYTKDDISRRDDNLAHCKALQQDLDNFQSQLSDLYKAGDDVTRNMDPSSIVSITSKLSGLEQRVLTLRQKLGKHIQSLQGDLSHQRRFREAFNAVNAFLSQAQRILGMEDPNKAADEKVLHDRLDHLKELSSQFTDNLQKLDALNDLGYRLALNETSAAELQDLNHKWHDMYSDTKERCKTLQGILLIQQDFTEKCDLWMTFLAQTENDLSTEIAGNLIDLLDQQRKCEKFESEMYSRQQILHAIISDGQTMMNEGDIDNKEEFQQKLHLLAEQWQSVIRRANQRKAIIDSTIKQWQAFNDAAEKLREWLKEEEEGLEVFTFNTASLQKVKNLVEKAKNNQHEFKLQEDVFKSMNDQGKQLLTRADDKAQEELRISMAQIQQHWHQLFVKLDELRESLEAVLKQWQECEDDIEEILTWLKDTRKTLNVKLPTAYEDLQADMHRCKDIEAAFLNAEPKRQALLSKERGLGKTIEPEDLNILHQRIRLLNKQWDELKNQASLRGQRIDDTMFRWSNFSEKFKELCDWIDRMEVKVISSKDLHIEDLLNRMQRDYSAEMSEKEKTKNDLIQQGHTLMKVSSEVRASDIDQKCTRLEDKWQHLKAIVGFRQRKLQETLLAVQQLDVSMSNLRKWLADMELELCAPVIYQDCARKEIQRKLQHQSELQQDIERHSPGVGSVLNLCEVLLHDSDACPTDIEFSGLQTAMKNLERRWRTICQMSPEQRTRIEETWDLWQSLMEDCRVFGEWLKIMEAEVKVASPDQASVATSKEEFVRCETIQRKLHENLSKLENINKQYRRLAREGRTDAAGTLKTMMQEANDRWDQLQGQMSAILRQLKHSSSIKEDFKRSKESLMSWLTEIDVQLTNIDHLSSMDVNAKLGEIKRIQEEIDSRAKKFDYVDEVGLYIIQKGDSSDAIAVQLELDEFRQYHRQVLDRVALTETRLQRQAKSKDDDELDRLEKELYASTPGDPYSLDWDMREIEAYLDSSPPESPPEKRRALLRARARARSRSKSPVRTPPVTSTPVQSIPSRSRSPTRYRGKSPRRVVQDVVARARSPTRQERWSQLKGELDQRPGKQVKLDDILEKLVDALMDADEKLRVAERELHSRTPTGPDVEQKSANYLQSMSNCEKSVDDVRRIDRLLKAETGLRTIASADEQVKSIVQRWEVLQAAAIQKDFRLSQHRQDWSQFKSDLDNMLSWLDEAEALQHTHKPLPGEITRLDTIIRQHKDFLVQLESKKTRVISINLTSRELIDITTDEGRLLKERLKVMNKRWDAICGQATRLQQELQVALMQCQEFHHTIHDLLLWLENTETKIQQCEPVNIAADNAALWSRLRKLRDIKFDLEKNQPRVMSLKDTADQLLISSDSPEMSNAKDKMHIIANRLRALLRLCSSYITSLETRLDSVTASPHSSSIDLSGSPASSEPGSPRGGRTSTPRYSPFRPGSSSSVRVRPRSPFAITRQLFSRVVRPFGLGLPAGGAEEYTSTDLHDVELGSRHRPAYFFRILRAAIPLHLLLILLLGLACLIPLTEDDYSCTLANNFRRSLELMLQYTDGPPPV